MELNQIHTAVLESMNEAVYVRDCHKRILYINPASEKLTGWSAKEAVGKKCYEVFGDRKRNCRSVCPAEKVISQGAALRHHEGELRSNTGDMRRMRVSMSPVKDHRAVIGAVVVMEDITSLKEVEQTSQKNLIALENEIEERKQAENALRYRQKFQQLVSNISTRFINLADDKIDKEIDRTLRQIGEFAGVDRSYVFLFTEGKKTVDNTHEWCAKGIEPEIENLKGIAIDQELPWFSKKIRNLAVCHVPNVAELPSEARTEREHFEAQQILSLIVVPIICDGVLLGFAGFDSVRTKTSWTDDIIGLLRIVGEIVANAIARKKGEEQKERLQNQLQKSQKMEAVGTLAAGIAHNFNNLLSVISGNVSLMLLDTPPDHEHWEMLTMVQKEVKDGARLTGQLLGYARKGQYYLKPVNLNDLIKDSCFTLGQTRKDISIHQDLDDALFAIKADEDQLKQVLLNLCVNAAEAMSDGGDLFLKTTNITPEDNMDRRYGLKSSNGVHMKISDTGRGMDEETLAHVFEPFFTTKEAGRGSGLGLASVYGVIRAHGGCIDVVSRERRGTTFNIYLPAMDKQIGKMLSGAMGEGEGKGTILFVDDEVAVLEVGVKVLRRLGYTVLEARSGKEAVQMYHQHKNNIDVIILDMVMPDMSGSDAYDQFIRINPDAKVLLASGYSIDSHAKEILARGCNGFIQKPFTIKELSGAVQRISGESRRRSNV